MNIGLVTYWFERGAALVSRAYMEALAAKHNVFIYARGGEKSGQGDPKWDRPYVTWGKPAGSERVPTAIDWSDFKAWIMQRQIDAIIFNEQHSWDVVVRSMDLTATVGAYVDYYTSETIPFFALYDFLLCNTQRHYGVFKDHPQACYIPWGTDCDVFQPTNTSPVEDVRFFHSAGMGGVELRKGTDILVRAFQKVSGSATLIIHSQVGLDRYGAVAELIKHDPRIKFIEATVGAPGLYHLGDVYVYPTKLEGIGLTIAEALACGLPVITTDCAPMNEFVLDHINGKLVEVSHYLKRADDYYWPQSICSEVALTSAMQFYVNNPLELTRQKRAARSYALEHLDWRTSSALLPDQITQFSKIDKPPAVVTAARNYERKRQAHIHMDLAFTEYDRDHFGLVRRHMLHGLRLDPSWLRLRGVWSIGLKSTLGSPFKQALKPWLRRPS